MTVQQLAGIGRRVLAAACLAGACVPAAAHTYLVQRLSARTVLFKGLIGVDSANALLAELDKGAAVLVVRSEGGDARAGMVLGEAVHRAGLTVIVDGYCASSCANYVFLSALRKILADGSLLGFHGALTAGLADAKLERIRAGRAAKNEHALIDVDEHVRRELDWLKLVGLSRSLFQHVSGHMQAELRRLKRSTESRSTGAFTIRVGDTVQTFTFDEARKIDELIARYQAEGVKFSAEGTFERTLGGDLSDVLYFPSLRTLQQHGVSGMLRYSYPASQQELERLGARWFDAIHVRGDFDDARRQSGE